MEADGRDQTHLTLFILDLLEIIVYLFLFFSRCQSVIFWDTKAPNKEVNSKLSYKHNPKFQSEQSKHTVYNTEFLQSVSQSVWHTALL